MHIKQWAEANRKDELLGHIACATRNYANTGLYTKNIFYLEQSHQVILTVTPKADRHASHMIGDNILFHGGDIAKLFDVATCALAFTMCDEKHIPVTRAIKDIEFISAGIIGFGDITITCHLSEDNERDMLISAICSQGERVIAKGIVTISRVRKRAIEGQFRRLAEMQKA
jgi:acyl-coenzyme A thioesterase PaaI-like protein